MSAPEEQFPGGDSPSSARLGQHACFPESLTYPQDIVDAASSLVWEVRKAHNDIQASLDRHVRVYLPADTWILIRDTACETVTLSDDDLLERARIYDKEVLPDDPIGLAERERCGSLLDVLAEYQDYYDEQNPDQESAAILPTLELRKRVACRTLRLARLSQLSPSEHARLQYYELADAEMLVQHITRFLWLQLFHNADAATPGQPLPQEALK